MPTISEYTNELHIPQYKPTNYDVSLDVALLRKKQLEYDTALSKIKGLESKALNIQMINAEGKEKLDQYNKKLDEELSKDLGDLSKIEVQNKVAGLFQDIASDSSLIKASKLSKQYIDQVDMINSFRQSGKKDKGYNAINESVFLEWDGGYNDFVTKGLNEVTDPNFKPIKYVPFKELDTKLLNIAKTLHQDSIKRQQPTGNGYLQYTEDTGVSPERISELMQSQFDQEDLEQLDQMAKYEVLRTRKLNAIPDFHQKYSTFSDNEIKRVEAAQSKARQQIDYFETQLKSSKLTPEEKVAITGQIAELEANEQIHADRAFSLRNSKKDVNDFNAMSNDELLEYAKQMQWSTKIAGISDALSWKTDVNMYKEDQTYLALKKLDTIRWQENVRASTKMALARMAKTKEEKGPEFSTPGDPIKNKQDVFTGFSQLTSLQEQMAKQTNRVITSSPSFSPGQLMDKGWVKANANNYEVKMWDVFSKQFPAIKDGKPQTEAFKLWLKDQETNPSTPFIQSLVDQQRRDEFVSDYVDDKVMEINKAARTEADEFELLSGYNLYDASGRLLSKDDYDNGTPAYLGVPIDARKSGYKMVRLEDAITEANKQFQLESSYNKGYETPGFNLGLKVPTSYITNDGGLYKTLLDISTKRKGSDEMVKKILTEKLPQIAQFGMSQTLNREAIESKIGDIMGAAKNTNPDLPFGIGVDDIEFANVPVGNGQYGQFKIKDSAAKLYGEEGWTLPAAGNPNELIPIKPGATYAFKTQPISPYDTYFNLILNERPWIDSYKGYKIEMSKSEVTPNVVFINVYDPSGTIISQQQQPARGEAKVYLEQTKRGIDILTNKK